MSNCVSQRALKAAAFAGLVAGAAALSGCTALGSRALVDNTATSSTAPVMTAGAQSQPMPQALYPQSQRAFVPPSDIGGSGADFGVAGVTPQGGLMPQSSVMTNELPVLDSSTPRNANPMSAHTTSAAVQLAARPANLGQTAPSADFADAPAVTAAPLNTAAAPANGFFHVIESGESLYTIARRYNVTAQALVQANGLNSPDKIVVGQQIVIPGRPDLVPPKGPTNTAPAAATSAPDVQVASVSPNASTPIASPQLIESNTPVTPVATAENRPLQQPAVEPALSGADKFRWPVSGRVIADFAASKQTGINIEVPEGAAIRAAENGQVIYVGNGVEGYGNLILIRHPNGYVSAYAHLKDMKVQKGDVVNRGDQIGSGGMTGSVSRPQLHFELRKGATPVDPIPLLAS